MRQYIERELGGPPACHAVTVGGLELETVMARGQTGVGRPAHGVAFQPSILQTGKPEAQLHLLRGDETRGCEANGKVAFARPHLDAGAAGHDDAAAGVETLDLRQWGDRVRPDPVRVDHG
jgi:hypothetical protein